MTRRDSVQVALWVSLCQLIPLLCVTLCDDLLRRGTSLAEDAGIPRPVQVTPLESILIITSFASILGGPFAGLIAAKRRIPGATTVPFLAVLPVCAGWVLAWAFLPLWPGWASRLLVHWHVPPVITRYG